MVIGRVCVLGMCVVSGGWSGSVSRVHYFSRHKSCMCLVQVLY